MYATSAPYISMHSNFFFANTSLPKLPPTELDQHKVQPQPHPAVSTTITSTPALPSALPYLASPSTMSMTADTSQASDRGRAAQGATSRRSTPLSPPPPPAPAAAGGGDVPSPPAPAFLGPAAEALAFTPPLSLGQGRPGYGATDSAGHHLNRLNSAQHCLISAARALASIWA